jgi:hypothetical protein
MIVFSPDALTDVERLRTFQLRMGSIVFGFSEFRLTLNPNHFYIPHRLVPLEGRLAIVTNAGRDAVDAGGASDEGASCGRRSRVVLTPRRWRQVCGRQLSQATVANKPGHRGERGGNR